MDAKNSKASSILNKQVDTLSLCPEPILILNQGQQGTLAIADTGHILCPTEVGDHISPAHAGNVENTTRQQCDPEGAEVTNPQSAPYTQLPNSMHSWLNGGQSYTTVLPEMDH